METTLELGTVSDEELIASTRNLARHDRQLTLQVIRHLREIDARGLHFDRGYPSLYEFVVKELRYSEGAAYRRIQAMRLIKSRPEAAKKLEDGSLSLNTAAKIQSACRKNPELDPMELMERLGGKPTREVDRELANSTGVKESARWITTEAVELTLLLDKPSFENLDELKVIKSHTPASSTYSGLVKELIDLGQSKWNPMRRTAPPARGDGASVGAGRAISARLRTEVWQRDQSQCSYTDPVSGKRCGSRHYLQIDHIQPLALGGKSSLENLRLLCAQHNRHRAGKTFGPRPAQGPSFS